jgi:Fe-S cluster assembly protein SufD
MAKLDLAEHYEAQVMPADAAAAQRRSAALARFRELGVPVKRMEAWRYTETRPLARRAFIPASTEDTGADAVVPDAHRIDDGSHQLHIVDGRLQADESLEVLASSGVHVRAMSAGQQVPLPDLSDQEIPDGLLALHLAFITDAIEIELDAGAVLDRPLSITTVASDGSTPRLVCPRLSVRLGTNARLTLIEQRIIGDGDEDLSNAVLDIELAQGAQLDLTRMRVGADAGFHLDRCSAHLAQDSRLHATHLDLAGRWNRSEVRIDLAGRGACVSLEGLYLPADEQLHDHHLEIIHSAPDTTSNQRYRGVLSGRSRGVFSGRVLIQQDAQRSDATQENRNLLLSAESEIDTKPELEIYADDVKAAHGATIGQLDEAAMFYLLSRGIDEETARALLVFAFADEVLTQLPSPELRRYVEQQVMAALPDIAGIEGQTEVAA